jgi:hypothetical protein
MERAPGTFAAYIWIEKPGGTRIDLRFSAVRQPAEEENSNENSNRKEPERVGTRFMGVPFFWTSDAPPNTPGAVLI